MFQGLRGNSIFYILDKSDKPVLKVGQVVKVSNPQPKFGYNPSTPFNTETTVDVVVKVGEEEINLQQLPSQQSVTDCHGLVVSDSREAMCAEVEAMLRNSRSVVDSIPYHNAVIASCDEILGELNPQFAKEKQHEEKINGLEERISNIDRSMDELKDMLSKALGAV